MSQWRVTALTCENLRHVLLLIVIMSILYFNARSLTPKHDKLCTIVKAHNPDMICVDILDSAWDCLAGIASAYRRDRWIHGGGILFMLDSFACSILPSSDSLEITILHVCHGSSRAYVSLFSDPPVLQVLRCLKILLYNCMQTLNVSWFCDCILLGNLNVNFSNHAPPFYSWLSRI